MREGVVYIILFVLILGAGAVLILPRLTGGAGRSDAEPEAAGDPAEDTFTSDASTIVPGPVRRVRPLFTDTQLALPAGVDVMVVGSNGPLQGALREIVGAHVDESDPKGDGVRVVLTATAPRIAFGAVGHQWVEVPVDRLAPGLRIALPEAAPPIVISVQETDGTPAADVPVRVAPAGFGSPPRTDAAGRVVIDHVPAGLVTVELDTAERAGPGLRLRAGVDRDAQVTLEPAWRVSGRVVDGGGRALAGAQVEAFAPSGAWGRETTTDDEGRFTWRGPATVAFALRVRAAGFAERAVEAMPPAVGDLATDVGDVVLADAPLTVVCQVEAGVPTDGAFIEVEPLVSEVLDDLFGPGTTLDVARRRPLPHSGTVRFDDLPPDLPLRVSVRGAGVPADVVVTGPAGTTQEITLRPGPGHIVAGTLVNAGGVPLSGARLFLSRDPIEGDGFRPGDVEVITGAQGRFQHFGLPGSEVFVRAYVPGHRSLLRRISLPLDEPVELTLERALTDVERRVEGVVVDSAGEPLEGVRVRAAGVAATTDAAGRFRLDGVESLAPVVSIAYGYEPGALPPGAPHPRPFVALAVFDMTPGTGRALELVLPRASTVTLRALDGIDETPLAFVHLVLRSDRGRLLFDRGVAPHAGVIQVSGLAAATSVVLPRRTDADGNTQVVPLGPSTVRVAALTHSRRIERVVTVPASGAGPLEVLFLPRGMLIRGVVKTKGGRPVAGARVAGMDDGWQSRATDPVAEREVLFRTAVTDDLGRFTLEGFDPRRRADLAVWAPGLAPSALRVVLPAFSDEIETSCEVTLEEGGHLAFILQDEGSLRPIDGAVMDAEHARNGADYLDLLRAGMLAGFVGSSAEWKHASELLLFASHEPGSYSLGPMRPGPYEVWIERFGYEPVRRKITVFERGENVFDIYSGTTRTVQGDTARMIFLMRGR